MKTFFPRAAVAIFMITVSSITGSGARAQEAQTAHPMTGRGANVLRLTPAELN